MKFFSRNKQNKDRNNKYKRYRKPEMQIQKLPFEQRRECREID